MIKYYLVQIQSTNFLQNIQKIYTMHKIEKKQQQQKADILLKRIKFRNLKHTFSSKKIIPKQQVQKKPNTQYELLNKKLQSLQSMKASHRGFNKSLYGKLSGKIVQKPIAFYKYGLSLQQKKSCKIIFQELFEAPKQKLNGTISVCELWDNKTTVMYLKENKMFYNKKLLLKEFEDMNKQRQLRKKQISKKRDNEFVATYKKLMKKRQNSSLRKSCSLHGKTPQILCKDIQNKLKKMSSEQSQEIDKNRFMIKKLQKKSDKFAEIKDKFYDKMILLL